MTTNEHQPTRLIPLQPLAIADGTRIAKSIESVTDDQLPILECFFGIEGEGLEIGEPRILLRVGGCRVGCTGCDTPHSWSLKGSTIMSMDEVEALLADQLDKHPVATVAITGGEPMHYPVQMIRLAKFLNDRHVRSWLETSGLLLSSEHVSEFSFLSLDVKTPSSGPACFTPETVAKFREFVLTHVYYGQVKMIVTGPEDIAWIEEHFGDWVEDGAPIFSTLDSAARQPLVITPACGKDSTLAQLAERCKLAADAWPAGNVRIIAQQHAILGLR